MTVLDRLPALAPGTAHFSDLQKQVDGCVGAFANQALELKSLASMSAGSLAYRAGRLGALGLGNGSFFRAASVLLGLGAEVSTFEGTRRSLESWTTGSQNSALWRWKGTGGLAQGLLQSLITFGSLKGAGRLAQGENFLTQHALQDSAMVFSHQAGAALGFTLPPEGNLAEQFLHAEATNLQIGAGMALAHAFAPGLQALERGLDLSAPGTKDSVFPSAFEIFFNRRAWAAASPSREQGKALDFLLNSSRPYLMVKDSSGGGEGRGKRFDSLSVRQLIHEVRENNDAEAARELARRAAREPRLFFQSYELKWILGALAIPRNVRIEECLLFTVRNLLDNAWGIFDEAHLQEMLQLAKDRSLWAAELSIMIKKLKDLRPEIAFAAALREMAPDFPLSEVGRSGLVAQFESAPIQDRFTFHPKKIRITAETIEFDGRVEFHDESPGALPTLPRQFHGDLVGGESEPSKFTFDTPEWDRKIEGALADMRLGRKDAKNALVRLLNQYVDEPVNEFSFHGFSKFKRLDQISACREEEIQEALKAIPVDWMIQAAKSAPMLRDDLQNLARLDHPGALSGLVELANAGYKFARPLLRELEMRRLVKEVAAGDVLAQADLIHFLSLKDLTAEEADLAAIGLLRAAEAAYARKDAFLAEFAFAKLYGLCLSSHRSKVFERIHPYEGTLFRTLREKVETSPLGIAASAFLFEAARMSSFDALEILIAVAPKDRKAQDRLREILREIPKEDLPEVIEVTDRRLSFGEEMALHVRLRQQKMRKRIIQALAQILKGDET